jgi:hypothetical protein
MSARAILLVAGAAVAAEVVRRAFAKSSAIRKVPLVVAEQANAELAGLELRTPVRDYLEAYVEQKRELIQQFGSAMEYTCSPNIFGVCLPNPSKLIPTASRDATMRAARNWSSVAGRVFDGDEISGELEDLVGVHLVGLLGHINRVGPGGIGSGSGKLDDDTNRRVWSHINQLALLLEGVRFSEGDIELAARRELTRTVTDPTAYANAAGDAISAVTGFVASVAGRTAGKVIASNFGAIAIVGGVTYLVIRRSL